MWPSGVILWKGGEVIHSSNIYWCHILWNDLGIQNQKKHVVSALKNFKVLQIGMCVTVSVWQEN